MHRKMDDSQLDEIYFRPPIECVVIPKYMLLHLT